MAIKSYKVIQELTAEELLRAYDELNMDKLPPKDTSIVRVLQTKVSREAGDTVSLSHTKYLVAMEMLKRYHENIL